MAKDEEKKPATTPYMGAKPGATGTPAAKPEPVAGDPREGAAAAPPDADDAGSKIADVRRNHPAQKVAEQLRDLMLASLTDQTEQPDRDVEPLTPSRVPPKVTDEGVVIQEGGEGGGDGGGGGGGEAGPPAGGAPGGAPMAAGGGAGPGGGAGGAPYMGVRRG